ncbi:hypothetical protein TSPI_04047 [Trichinella spiralis]|uniref:Uncharacterized protein n=1 Tax=Trichinella spiralis TaxID=6334 RepID=A0ABR3KCS7_TRISP
MDDYLCLPHITKSSCGSTPLSFMMVPSTGNFRFRSSTASCQIRYNPHAFQVLLPLPFLYKFTCSKQS